jgi:hypothetical protein
MAGFSRIPRGRPLRGSRAIAEHMLDDPNAGETVCALPRDEFGFVKLGRDLTGFTGWIDHALAIRARAGKGRRKAKPAESAGQHQVLARRSQSPSGRRTIPADVARRAARARRGYCQARVRESDRVRARRPRCTRSPGGIPGFFGAIQGSWIQLEQDQF